jgi:hypothetical protein
MKARLPVAVVLLLAALAAPSTASAAGGPAAPIKDVCIDANEAAQPLVKAGKLIDARQKLLVCIAASCPGPIREDCTQRLADVQAKIPTIVFVVTDDANHDLSAVRVTIDGRPLVERLDGTAVAVDPGEHRFMFEAAGLAPEARTLVVHEGDRDRREQVVLVPAATPAPPPAASGSGQRIAGLALAGAGVAGLIVGGVFGVLTKTTYDHALSTDCPNSDPKACSGTFAKDWTTVQTQSLVSTVGFAAGAALLTAGAVLYFTAPRDHGLAVTASMAPGGARFEARYEW